MEHIGDGYDSGEWRCLYKCATYGNSQEAKFKVRETENSLPIS